MSKAIAGIAVLSVAALSVAQPAAAAVGSTARITPSFNGSVYAIAYQGDTVYVGGSFTRTVIDGRSIERERLAAFDARTGKLLDWTPSADDTVRALAVTDDSVYVGGDFDRIDGSRRDALARIDADSGSLRSFRHGVDGGVRTLTVGDGRLYAGGSISRVDDSPRSRAAAFSLATGLLDESWTPSPDNTVNSLAYHDGQVYLGGSFEGRLSRVDSETGDTDDDFAPAPPAMVHAVAVDDSGVYAAMGGQGGRAASYSLSGTPRWSRVFDGDAQAIAVLDGTAYVGGHFDHACSAGDEGDQGECHEDSVSRVKLAAVEPSGSLSDWAPQANGIAGVRTIAVDRARGTVAAGGDFTTIGGETQRRFAAFG
jgi:putative pyrroloquinoline-quinone binding quinoprotein